MNDTLFLTLKVFSATGGIEKVCRVAGKALYEYGVEYNRSVMVYSMHDPVYAAENNKYFPSELFKGYGAHKMRFINAAVQKGAASRVVIISHINLLLVGWMIKKISPGTKIILFAHGIEIWNKLSPTRKMMLNICDEIISVSHFTSERIQSVHGMSSEKCKVLNNCLDPFLPLPTGRIKDPVLLERYGFSKTDKVLLTLTRLSAKERYKGYDKVLQAMVQLREKYSGLRYLLAGSYDPIEKQYVDDLITKYELNRFVVMPGYIPDEELNAHFAMADIYVMPSMKEGFGIVFIEAMNYGLPVIAGNIDGSVDALCNGELGSLVDPLSISEISIAIKNILDNPDPFIPDRKALIYNFGYDNYKRKLEEVLLEPQVV